MNHGPHPPYWSIAIELARENALDSIVDVRAVLVGHNTGSQPPLCIKQIAWKVLRERLLSVGFRLFGDNLTDPEMKQAAGKLVNGRTIKGWLNGAERVVELQSIGFAGAPEGFSQLANIASGGKAPSSSLREVLLFDIAPACDE
jgi:hypothetical protein